MIKLVVLDSEGIGLSSNATKLHNLCSTTDGKEFFYTTDYDEMREHLLNVDIIVCHNALRHDMPVFNKVLGLSLTHEKFIDTLALSWALYPDRAKHSLESWGETVGIKKVSVDEHEWEIGDETLMKERVIEDVKINWAVWQIMCNKLEEIYL